MEQQYLDSSLRTLKEEFEQLTSEASITKEQVNQLFDKQKTAISTLWDEFIESHSRVPERVNKLEQGKDLILGRLNALQTRVMGEVDRLFDTAQPELIRRQHRERYEQFLSVLREQNLMNQLPPSFRPSERTARVRREARTSQGRREESPASPRRSTDTPLRNPPEAPASPRRPAHTPRPQEATETQREMADLLIQIIEVVDKWPEREEYKVFCNQLFSRMFSPPQRNEAVPILRLAVQNPRQLQELARLYYRDYQKMKQNEPRWRAGEFLPFINQIQFQFEGENVPDLIRTLRENARMIQAREELRREVQQNPDLPREIDPFLNQFEATLLKREIPSREDLLKIERMVSFVERELLENQPLTWNGVIDSQSVPSQTPPNVQIISSSAQYRLQGKSFEVRRVPAYPNGTFSSRTVLIQENRTLSFDLPRFIHTLKILKNKTSWLYRDNAEPVSMARLTQQLSNPENRDALQERLNLEWYQGVMRSMGLDNQRNYEDFPRALSDLLGQQLRPTEQNTPQEWLEKIGQLQRTPDMSDSSYRFLWVVRFIARTRKVNNTEKMNIADFSRALLQSRDFHDPYITAPGTKGLMIDSLGEPGSTEEENHLRAQRHDNLDFEYDDYLTSFPAVKMIENFYDQFQSVEDNGKIFLEHPWPRVVSVLEMAENAYHTDPSGRVEMPEPKFRIPPNVDPKMIDKYHQLKETNPLFRELVLMGAHYSSSGGVLDKYVTLRQLLDHVLTPNGVSPEGEE